MGEQRMSRWYFGGLASCGAACCTHPLDLLKVHLQTQQVATMGGKQMAVHIVKHQGLLALYNGLSASLLRQLTYSTTRFAIYEMVKQQMDSSGPIPFYQRAFVAGCAGACGGFVGTPGDMINVRMQNDIKLPADQKRNGRSEASDKATTESQPPQSLPPAGGNRNSTYRGDPRLELRCDVITQGSLPHNLWQDQHHASVTNHVTQGLYWAGSNKCSGRPAPLSVPMQSWKQSEPLPMHPPVHVLPLMSIPSAPPPYDTQGVTQQPPAPACAVKPASATTFTCNNLQETQI